MCIARNFAIFICVSVVASLPAAASNLVTGNGFGFAVVSPTTSTVTCFYAHPYSFAQPDPKDPLSEGIPTANFIKRVGWNDGGAQGASAEYEEDSNVIHARNRGGEGLFFMPFGLARTALILSWEPAEAKTSRGALSVEWNRPVTSQKVVSMLGTEVRMLKFDGIQESLMLIPLDRQQVQPATKQQYLSGARAWALLSLENDGELESALRDFIHWRAATHTAGSGKARDYRNGALARQTHCPFHRRKRTAPMASKRSHASHGAKPRAQPSRAVQQRLHRCRPAGCCVVHDMGARHGIRRIAFARMGHQQEARAAFWRYFNARPTGKMRSQTNGVDYQISVVRYFGDGSEEPFFTNEGAINIEFDDWGLALWVLGEYMRQYDDPTLLATPSYRGAVYKSARDYVVKPLLANMEKHDHGLIVAADTSIWEEHQKDKKHFAFSTAAAIMGLRDFAEVARREGDEATRTDLLQKVSLLEHGFDAAFIRDGKLRGTLEEGVKNDIDGALLAIINFGLVTDPAVVHDTIQRMDLLKVSSGGYRRVRSTYTDPAIYEYWYERQEFVFVDFSLAEVYRRMGRNDEAAAILKRIVDKSAADHNIVPEMYVALPCKLFPGNVGDPTGAIPMVGYGAGAYILDFLQRATWSDRHRS